MSGTSDKRERLLNAATNLMHQQGYNQTTLADIARESEVPLGNVYYYFKTKDDIAAAVMEQRKAELRAMTRKWETEPSPKKRLLAFLGMALDLREDLARHGCPVGSLCQELDKDRTPLAEKADDILKLMLRWVTKQFEQLGRDDAADLGIQFVASLQGGILLANATHDPDIVTRQVKHIEDWLGRV